MFCFLLRVLYEQISKFLTKKAALNCIEHKISTENVSLTLTNHYTSNTSSLLKMSNESTSKMAKKKWPCCSYSRRSFGTDPSEN